MAKTKWTSGGRAGGLILLGVTLCVVGGCIPKPPPPDPKPVAYDGPLESMQAVVLRVSQQNAALRTLWARHDFSMKVVDREGKQTDFDGDGVLMLRKPALGETTPAELRLQGSKDVYGEVFDAGANPKQAWLILRKDEGQMFWFEQANADRVESDLLPARPDQLADVLGLADLSTDLSAYPAPVMRYDGGNDCYVLLFVEPAIGPERLITRREMWVGRKDCRARRVVLYGADGRVVAQSELGSWAPLEAGKGSAVGAGGWAPRDITVTCPQSRFSMRLTLRDVQGTSERGYPKDGSFAFPREPGVGRVEELGK